MNSIKKQFIITLFLFLGYSGSFPVFSKVNPDSIQKTIEKAYFQYDLPLLQTAYEKLNQEIKNDPGNNLLIYYRAFAEYRFLGFCFDSTKAGIFDKYYDTAKIHTEKIITLQGFESEGKTLLSGIYMIRLAIKRMEAPILSMKINTLLDEALQNNPENPRALYIKALMKAQTPEIFGGNKKEAIKMFQQAVMIFEKEQENTKITWGYLETLAWLGQTLVSLGEFEDAEFAYNKILSIEPEFGWVKHYLLPQLEKAKNKKNKENK